MLPSPTELTYFSEVAAFQNISRASKKLSVSQPTLTLAIKKLEHTLDTHLFVRHKQGVTLTPAGEKLLEQVKPLLQHWNKTRLQIKESHDTVQGAVSIGCRSITPICLRGTILQLLECFPQLTFNFQFLNRDQITQSVINSTIDVGIVSNPYEHGDLIIRKIGKLEFGLWTGHSNNRMQDLHSGEAVIICEADAPQAQLLIKKLEASHIKIARIMEVNSLDVVANMAAGGLGIGIVPSRLAMRTYAGKLRLIENTPSSTENLCLIYRYENKDVLAVKTLVDALSELISDWQQPDNADEYEICS